MVLRHLVRHSCPTWLLLNCSRSSTSLVRLCTPLLAPCTLTSLRGYSSGMVAWGRRTPSSTLVYLSLSSQRLTTSSRGLIAFHAPVLIPSLVFSLNYCLPSCWTSGFQTRSSYYCIAINRLIWLKTFIIPSKKILEYIFLFPSSTGFALSPPPSNVLTLLIS